MPGEERAKQTDGGKVSLQQETASGRFYRFAVIRFLSLSRHVILQTSQPPPFSVSSHLCDEFRVVHLLQASSRTKSDTFWRRDHPTSRHATRPSRTNGATLRSPNPSKSRTSTRHRNLLSERKARHLGSIILGSQSARRQRSIRKPSDGSLRSCLRLLGLEFCRIRSSNQAWMRPAGCPGFCPAMFGSSCSA